MACARWSNGRPPRPSTTPSSTRPRLACASTRGARSRACAARRASGCCARAARRRRWTRPSRARSAW
ncbi:MAG: hypothetical protein FJ265_21580 [Planctomycetes bacterium]|nr:hypothetical protein [Planctomycetota bacterium]